MEKTTTGTVVTVVRADGTKVEVPFKNGMTRDDVLTAAGLDPTNPAGQATVTIGDRVLAGTDAVCEGDEVVVTPPIKNG